MSKRILADYLHYMATCTVSSIFDLSLKAIENLFFVTQVVSLFLQYSLLCIVC